MGIEVSKDHVSKSQPQLHGENCIKELEDKLQGNIDKESKKRDKMVKESVMYLMNKYKINNI